MSGSRASPQSGLVWSGDPTFSLLLPETQSIDVTMLLTLTFVNVDDQPPDAVVVTASLSVLFTREAPTFLCSSYGKGRTPSLPSPPLLSPPLSSHHLPSSPVPQQNKTFKTFLFSQAFSSFSAH